MIKIREKVDLKPYNTFGISAEAKYFADITSEAGFRELINFDNKT